MCMKTITIDGIEYNLVPKNNFKKFDWVASNVCKCDLLHIIDVDDRQYKVETPQGNMGCPSIAYIDNNFHLFSIQDAKDCDVISYDDGWTCIFKHIHGIWYSSYCFITADGEFHTGYEEHAVDSKINGNAHPATKEQRDKLEKAMLKAGYKWNTEERKLEKI